MIASAFPAVVKTRGAAARVEGGLGALVETVALAEGGVELGYGQRSLVGVTVAATSAHFRVDGVLARVGFLVRLLALPDPESVLLETWSDFFGADPFVQVEHWVDVHRGRPVQARISSIDSVVLAHRSPGFSGSLSSQRVSFRWFR